MTDAKDKTIQIDLVSDVMCPWCIVGYRQLEKALEASGTKADITWHPFELNPQMPQDGQNFREHMAEKYGTSPEESARTRDHMTKAGAEVGFTFNFDDNMRMVNTFSAHQLLHWAAEQGKQHELKMELFDAHFTQRLNVNDNEVLASAAERVGLDKATSLALLEDQRYAAAVRESQQFWMQQGIQSVPSTVVNRRHLINGAQGEANFTQLLQQLALEESEQENTD